MARKDMGRQCPPLRELLGTTYLKTSSKSWLEGLTVITGYADRFTV